MSTLIKSLEVTAVRVSMDRPLASSVLEFYAPVKSVKLAKSTFPTRDTEVFFSHAKMTSELNVSNEMISELNVSNEMTSELNVSNEMTSELNVSNENDFTQKCFSSAKMTSELNVSNENDFRVKCLKRK